MYLSTVFYRKKDLYTISDIEIFIFYLNLMTLPYGCFFDERKNRTSKSPVRPVKYRYATPYIFTG